MLGSLLYALHFPRGLACFAIFLRAPFLAFVSRFCTLVPSPSLALCIAPKRKRGSVGKLTRDHPQKSHFCLAKGSLLFNDVMSYFFSIPQYTDDQLFLIFYHKFLKNWKIVNSVPFFANMRFLDWQKKSLNIYPYRSNPCIFFTLPSLGIP